MATNNMMMRLSIGTMAALATALALYLAWFITPLGCIVSLKETYCR
jgi:hypothetical protein